MRFFFSRTFIFHLTLAFAGFIFFCYLLLTFLKFFTYHNNLEEVPNLTGVLIDDAKKTIIDNKLRFEILDSSKFTPNFSPLSVLDQIPNPGDYVMRIKVAEKEDMATGHDIKDKIAERIPELGVEEPDSDYKRTTMGFMESLRKMVLQEIDRGPTGTNNKFHIRTDRGSHFDGRFLTRFHFLSNSKSKRGTIK